MTRPRLTMLLMGAAVLALAGCSGGAIDIPEGEAAPPASTVVPTQAPAPSADATAPEAAPGEVETVDPSQDVQTIDCATVLPVATVAEDLDIPVAYVSLTSASGPGSCLYTIAGNSGALQFGWADTEQSVEELEANWLQQYPTAETVVFADGGAAFTPDGTEASAGQPVVLISVSDGIQLSAYSYLGGQDELREFARDIYGGLGRTVG